MKPFAHKYKTYFSDRKFIFSLILSFLFLFGSLVVNFYAGTYATEKASNAVTDIILNNIPVYDVDMIFVYGPLVFWIFITLLCLYEPKRMPLVLKMIALFEIVRSVFITLTHIGPFPDHITIDMTSRVIKDFTFGGDLFFSAHTGLPFLMALCFWNNKFLRIIFIVTSIFFGAIVLMGHLHYSIDVMAAFFITYTIFHIGEVWFKKDKKIFDEGIENFLQDKID